MYRRQFLHHLLFPGSLLLALAFAAEHWQQLIPAYGTVLFFAACGVIGLGLFLGLRFNSSRLVYALLLLLLSGGLFHILPLVEYGERLLPWLGLLLPINLAWVAVVGERGLVSPVGLFRFSVILLQPVALDLAFRLRPELAGSLPKWPLLDENLLPALPLAQPAIFAFAVVCLLFLVRFFRRPQALEAAFLWSLAAVFTAMIRGEGEAPLLFLLAAGAILVGGVIETSHGMAYRDELTGLPGRRALNEYMSRLGSLYCVAMVDVDHFKKFNDTYGHDVGDQVLCMVASKLAAVGGGGKSFRYGGEEFTVVFPGRAADEAAPTLEALRETIAGSGFALRGPDRPKKAPKNVSRKKGGRETVGVTVSIGVATGRGRKCPAADVLKAADQALYRAKNEGRNRLCS